MIVLSCLVLFRQIFHEFIICSRNLMICDTAQHLCVYLYLCLCLMSSLLLWALSPPNLKGYIILLYFLRQSINTFKTFVYHDKETNWMCRENKVVFDERATQRIRSSILLSNRLAISNSSILRSIKRVNSV